MTEAENARKQLKAQVESLGQPRITLTALMIKVVAWALARNLYLSASFNGDSISLWWDVNIGVATAIPQRIVAPAIRHADHLWGNDNNLQWIEPVNRVRDNKLKLDDVQGGPFTFSNLDMFGIRQSHAVINPPESAILSELAVGAELPGLLLF